MEEEIKQVISFALNVIPFTTTHQSKKIVRIGNFSRLADTPQLHKVRSTYESLLARHAPDKPIATACRLSMYFMWPYLKSASKKLRTGIYPKTTKPDCSNLAKTLEDCLVRTGFITDDALVCSLEVKKAYAEQGKVFISITEI